MKTREEMDREVRKMNTADLLDELVNLGGMLSNVNPLVDVNTARYQAIKNAIEAIKDEMVRRTSK